MSPPLALANIPKDAKALAIIMDDPDAPRRTFTHWTAWNIPTAATDLPEDASISDLGGIEGLNDGGSTGYYGPCPPSGTHRYFFKVYALDAPLSLREGASVADVHKEVDAHVLTWGELMGTYARK